MNKLTLKRIFHDVIALFLGFIYLLICVVILLLIWRGTIRFEISDSITLFAVMEMFFLFFVACAISFIGKIFFKSKPSFLDTLSGRPGQRNYIWLGGPSILTGAILWLIKILRTVSILQLCKLFYRKISEENTDANSDRSNVSSTFQELYYIVWIGYLITQLSIGIHHPIAYALDIYFLIESSVWILYYAIFRRFFEEKYAVYHVMEHLPIIIILLPLQAISYAASCMFRGDNTAWDEILPVLLGQANEHNVIFSLLGFLYSAIVVSSIISNFPAERVKRGLPDTIVVGAGDVVRKRLLPAMVREMGHAERSRIGTIKVFTLKPSADLRNGLDNTLQYCERIPERTESIFELVSSKKTSPSVVAWIETPSDTHLYYLELLQDKADFIAMEKPMVADIHELVRIKEYLASENRKHTFFLSYYLLEKALMLTFLKRPRRFYLKYLSGDLMEFYQRFLELGHAKSIKIELKEVFDQRTLPIGGQLIETLIHHCLIASLFVGLPDTWKVSDYHNENDTNITIRAIGARNEVIELSLIKGVPQESKVQIAELRFENGTIIADFDKRSAELKMNGSDMESTIVSVAEQYSKPYDVLCDMVYECYLNDMDPSDIDGAYHQVEVLEWLLNLYIDSSLDDDPMEGQSPFEEPEDKSSR